MNITKKILGNMEMFLMISTDKNGKMKNIQKSTEAKIKSVKEEAEPKKPKRGHPRSTRANRSHLRSTIPKNKI